MKYIYGINITKDKTNQVVDGQIFHNNSTDDEFQREFQKYNYIIKNLSKDAPVLPIWMQIVEFISLLVGGFITVQIIQGLADIPLKQMYANAAALFHIAAVSLVLAFIIYLVKAHKKKAQKIDVYSYDKDYIEKAADYTRNAFQIPLDAVTIETLKFYYKVRHGKTVMIHKKGFPAVKLQLYAYSKNGNLYLADFFEEWCIPLYSVTGIEKLEKEKNYNYVLYIAWGSETYKLLMRWQDAEKLSKLLEYPMSKRTAEL